MTPQTPLHILECDSDFILMEWSKFPPKNPYDGTLPSGPDWHIVNFAIKSDNKIVTK